MSSQIDPSKPTTGSAYTDEVRDNFQAMKDEIEELQDLIAAILAGGSGRVVSRASMAHMRGRRQ